MALSGEGDWRHAESMVAAASVTGQRRDLGNSLSAKQFQILRSWASGTQEHRAGGISSSMDMGQEEKNELTNGRAIIRWSFALCLCEAPYLHAVTESSAPS